MTTSARISAYEDIPADMMEKAQQYHDELMGARC